MDIIKELMFNVTLILMMHQCTMDLTYFNISQTHTGDIKHAFYLSKIDFNYNGEFEVTLV